MPPGRTAAAAGYDWVRDTVGESGGSVYRLHGKASALTTDQLSALATDDFAALGTRGLRAFDSAQIGALSTDAIVAMTTAQAGSIVTTQSPGLTTLRPWRAPICGRSRRRPCAPSAATSSLR